MAPARQLFGRGLGGRKRDEEFRPLAGDAFDADLAAVRLHDVLHDRKPEPGAALLARAGLVDPIKTLEDPRPRLEWNAGTIVAHAQLHLAPFDGAAAE